MTSMIPLHRDQFTPHGRIILRHGDIAVHAFRYASGVEGLTLNNARGGITVLPYMGQMLWGAAFDGLELGMSSQFDMPRPADTIIGTYGCLGFHSGLLANGVPGPEDTHPVHGEFPTCEIATAELRFGKDARGLFVELWGKRDHVEGFGPHYWAEPTMRFYQDRTMIEWGMKVTNRSAFVMPLQYMAHLNPAFLQGATIHQPAPFTPDRTQVRKAVPAHVVPDPDYLGLIDRLAENPAEMQVLDRDEYQPEQVFYIRDPAVDTDGVAHLMLRRAEGDGIAVGYRPDQFPKLVRWIMANGDAKVAAFALPSTCEPEGRAAELAKGNVIDLAPGASAEFSTCFGYVDAKEAEALAATIKETGEQNV